MRRIVLVFIAAFLATAVVSCRSERVDCEKLGKRMFDECFDEWIVAAGGVTKEQMDEFKKRVDEYKETKEEALKDFIGKCKKDGGRDKNAADINKCLEMKSCDEFVECAKRWVDK